MVFQGAVPLCVLSINAWIFLACVCQSFVVIRLCFPTFHGSSINAWIIVLACRSIFHGRWALLSQFVFISTCWWLSCGCMACKFAVYCFFYFLFVGFAAAGTLSGLAPGAVNLSSSKLGSPLGGYPIYTSYHGRKNSQR